MSYSVHQPIKTVAYACVGFLLRVAAIAAFKDGASRRVEITTPISSWKRAYEAVYLFNSGLDPYAGNLFHEYPISLQFYKLIVSYLNIDLTFIATDIMTAVLLQHSVLNQLIMTNQPKEVAASRSMKVLLIYLLSPFTIISCAGKSTAIYTNFLIAVISFIMPMRPFRALTCVLCAFLACNNIHYGALILPIFLCLEFCSTKRTNGGSRNQAVVYYRKPEFYSSLSTSLMVCLTALATLIATSYILMANKWTFINSTYLFVLKVQDLTPNIGMFWYFFTEMFEHFISFFTCVVQINSFIHIVPLSVFLKDNPFFSMYIMIITSTIFQPYPSLSNIGLITSLLPQWSDLFQHMHRGLYVTCGAVTCMSLWPIFWHLWIAMGTANANFYFGATLAFTVSLIVLLIDLLNAHTKLVRPDTTSKVECK